jgi:hypothetical protein
MVQQKTTAKKRFNTARIRQHPEVVESNADLAENKICTGRKWREVWNVLKCSKQPASLLHQCVPDIMHILLVFKCSESRSFRSHGDVVRLLSTPQILHNLIWKCPIPASSRTYLDTLASRWERWFPQLESTDFKIRAMMCTNERDGAP